MIDFQCNLKVMRDIRSVHKTNTQSSSTLHNTYWYMYIATDLRVRQVFSAHHMHCVTSTANHYTCTVSYWAPYTMSCVTHRVKQLLNSSVWCCLVRETVWVAVIPRVFASLTRHKKWCVAWSTEGERDTIEKLSNMGGVSYCLLACSC